MSTSLLEFPGLRRGLVIPDASAEMPPESLGIATNCDITKSGAIKQRYGTRNAAVSQSSFQYAFVHGDDDPQLLVLGSDGNGRQYGAGGTTLVDNGAVTGGPTGASGAVQMLRSALSTANPNTYVSSPTNTLRRWDGTAFYDDLPLSPKCRYVVQAGWAERLLYCGFDAGATNGPNNTPVDKSIVGVSNPSEPEVYTTDDVTSIAPGDGEEVMGAVTYNGQTFVFKETSFFVFYGENDSGGAVELLYNQRSGTGCVQPGAIAVSPVGVFFLGDDGIYLTTGGTAVNVSENIGGLFTGELPSWTPYNRNLPNPTTPSTKFTVTADALYAAVSNTAAGGTQTTVILRYDYEMQAWSYYEFTANTILSMPWTNLSYPLMVGVVPDGANYRATVFHPLVRYDNDEFLPVEFQLRWFQTPDAQGYAGIDQAAIHRLDAWGAGIYEAATVIDYNNQPEPSKPLDFGDMAGLLTDVWPASDEWGDGTDLTDEWGDGTGLDYWGFAGATEVWGDGSDVTDVWGAGYGNETDLLRLQPPVHRYVFAPRGRGNYLTMRYTKAQTCTYCWMNPPRLTLQSR